VPKGVEPANRTGARLAIGELIIAVILSSAQSIKRSLRGSESVGLCARPAGRSASLRGVEAQRVMRGASVAQPKMFPPAKLPPTSIERGV